MARPFVCMDCVGSFEHDKVKGCVPKRCPDCAAALQRGRRRSWYQANRDYALAAAADAWRAKHPEELSRTCERCAVGFIVPAKSARRRYCDECQCVRARERRAAWKLRHPDRVEADWRAQSARPEVRAANALRAREKYAADPERGRAVARLHRERNPERTRELARLWKRKHPEKVASANRATRAQRAGAPIGEPYSRAEIFRRDGGRCHVCGRRCDPSRFEIDHLVPIARGGAECATNVALAHPTCNRKRGAGYLPAQLRMVG